MVPEALLVALVAELVAQIRLLEVHVAILVARLLDFVTLLVVHAHQLAVLEIQLVAHAALLVALVARQ
eukprot:3247435-Pyramimonas_sp.AAC.1